MKVLKKIASLFGYSITRKHKTEDLNQLIELRLKNNPCDCLLDVGANIGNFLDEYSSLFENSYAFEPNKDLIIKLNERFSKNKNIKIYEFGVGNVNGTNNFFVTGDKGKTLSSIKKQSQIISQILKNTQIIDEYNIKIIKLSDFIDKNNLSNKSFFLKTDTQGNDLEVLLGIESFIKNVKYIKIEMPVINIYEISYNFEKINKFMKSHNFHPLYIEHISRNKFGELVEYDAVFEKK